MPETTGEDRQSDDGSGGADEEPLNEPLTQRGVDAPRQPFGTGGSPEEE